MNSRAGFLVLFVLGALYIGTIAHSNSKCNSVELEKLNSLRKDPKCRAICKIECPRNPNPRCQNECPLKHTFKIGKCGCCNSCELPLKGSHNREERKEIETIKKKKLNKDEEDIDFNSDSDSGEKIRKLKQNKNDIEQDDKELIVKADRSDEDDIYSKYKRKSKSNRGIENEIENSLSDGKRRKKGGFDEPSDSNSASEDDVAIFVKHKGEKHDRDDDSHSYSSSSSSSESDSDEFGRHKHHKHHRGHDKNKGGKLHKTLRHAGRNSDDRSDEDAFSGLGGPLKALHGLKSHTKQLNGFGKILNGADSASDEYRGKHKKRGNGLDIISGLNINKDADKNRNKKQHKKNLLDTEDIPLADQFLL